MSQSNGTAVAVQPENPQIVEAELVSQQLADIEWAQHELEVESKALAEKRKGLVIALGNSLSHNLVGMETVEIDRVLSEIYWMEPEFAKIARTLRHALLGWDLVAPTPLAVEAPCRKCGQYEETVCTSWNDYKTNRFVCISCSRETKSQSAEFEQERRAANARLETEHVRLRTMSYSEYLKTEHWQNLRRIMLKKAVYKCQLCYAGGISLHVHHRTYERRGCEYLSDLIVLCQPCHEKHHDISENE